MNNLIKSSGFIIGFFGFGIFSAIDTHTKLNKLRKELELDEYLTHRRTNKSSIGQRSSSDAILRTNRKRCNECIKTKSK